MGQFDSATDAAKSQIAAKDRELGLMSRIPEGILDLGEFIAELIEKKEISLPFRAAISSLRFLAAKRQEENVEYLLDAVADDIGSLREEAKTQVGRISEIDSAVKGVRFAQLLTEAAVQATRTSSQERIKRLARVVVSGTISFPNESLDVVVDFERHCIELTDQDVHLLSFLSKHQARVNPNNFDEASWAQQIRHGWVNIPRTRGSGYAGISGLAARSAFSRLQSRGLICQLSWGNITAGAGSDPHAILDEGRSFLEFLRESSDANGSSSSVGH